MTCYVCANPTCLGECQPKVKEMEQPTPKPIISFTDNEEGLWVHMGCNGAHFSENLSEIKVAEFFVNAYRGIK